MSSEPNMLPSTPNSASFASMPIMVKIIMGINITLYIVELLIPSVISNYCLSPARVLANPQEFAPSLFLSNFFHLSPLTSGPMGVLHIVMNMMTLRQVGSFLEKEFGSIAFLGITLYLSLIVGPLQIPIAKLLNLLTMNSIRLFSLNQCGIGFSGILFGYFMIYLKVTRRETMTYFGVELKKWMMPFVQLLVLSFLLSASFIGHLSGIVSGLVYITGIPGCFQQRQSFIKKMEDSALFECISNRSDFICSSQQPVLSEINLIPCSTRVESAQYSRVGTANIPPSKGRVPRTIVNGVLVPKSSVTGNDNV